MIEVPGTALVDLLDLVDTAVEQMRLGEAPPALADALRGAVDHVRTSIFAVR